MASIQFQTSAKNLIFAALVANETGATFREEGQNIIIEDSPTLTVPQYCFHQAFDPEGHRARTEPARLESVWRSLLLNKSGYLRYFGDDEIVISDDPPETEARPALLLRFANQEQKAEAESLAERRGQSLTAFILEAVRLHAEQIQADRSC